MTLDIRRSSLRRVLQNFSALSLAEAVRVGLNGIATIYLARTLGAESFGIYGFALAVLGYLTTIVDGGLTVLGTREIARDRSYHERHAKTFLGLRLVLAIVAFSMLLVFVIVINKGEQVERVILLTSFSLFTYALTLDWIFYGLEKAQFVAAASVLKVAVFVGAVLLLIRSAEHIWLAPLLQASGEAVAVVWLGSIYITRFGWLWPSLNWQAWRKLFLEALPIGLSQVMRIVNYSFSVLAIGFMLNETAVGWFVAAQKLVMFALGFGALYFIAYLPSISRTFHESLEYLQIFLSRSIYQTALFTLPLALGTTILAERLIALIYGADYGPSAQALQVLIWSVPVIVAGSHFRYALIAANLQRLKLVLDALSALTNIVLTVLLIPASGLLGAALATIIAEAVLTVLYYVFTVRRIAPLSFIGHWPRVFCATGLMGIAVWLTQNWGVPLAVAIGGLVYFSLLLAVGEIQPRQIVRLFRAP